MGADWAPALRTLAEKESSLRPGIVNPVSVGGEHATGILQMLPSTFQENAVEGHGDIYNPVDNIISSIGYIKKRYGTPQNALQGWESRGGY